MLCRSKVMHLVSSPSATPRPLCGFRGYGLAFRETQRRNAYNFGREANHETGSRFLVLWIRTVVTSCYIQLVTGFLGGSPSWSQLDVSVQVFASLIILACFLFTQGARVMWDRSASWRHSACQVMNASLSEFSPKRRDLKMH